MTAKDKANDLIKRFENENLFFELDIFNDAKDSALITVNEIKEELKEWGEVWMKKRIEYWEEVENELNKQPE